MKINLMFCYLDHLGVESLSHLCPTVSQQHWTICVDVNQSSSLKTHKTPDHTFSGIHKKKHKFIETI